MLSCQVVRRLHRTLVPGRMTFSRQVPVFRITWPKNLGFLDIMDSSRLILVSALCTRYLPARQLCRKSRYWFCRWLCVRASIFMSVRTKCRKLTVKIECNSVGIWITVNAGSGWKLVTFDLDLWPWELFRTYIYSSLFTIKVAPNTYRKYLHKRTLNKHNHNTKKYLTRYTPPCKLPKIHQVAYMYVAWHLVVHNRTNFGTL